MVIGSVLLQPRKVPAAPPQTDLSLLEDVLTLLLRFFFDKAKGGTMTDDLLAALQAALQQIVADRESSLDAARQHMESLVAPLITRLQALGAGSATDSAAEEIFAAGGNLIHLLSDLIRSLTTEQVRAHLDQIFGVLQNDLGLSSAFLDQQIAALFDRIAARVAQAPAGAAPDVGDNRIQTAQLLRRLKRRLEGQFPFPALNADLLAGPLLQRMRRSNFDDFANIAANAAAAVDGSFAVCGTLLDVAPFSFGFSSGPPGAATPGQTDPDKKAWYASWLQGADVRTSGPPSPLTQIAFGPISQEKMEFWSKHSRWIQYGVEILFPMVVSASPAHRALFPFQQGNFANGTLQNLLTLSDAIFVPADDFDVPWYVNLPGATVFVLVGSFEGRSPFGQFDGLLYALRMLVKGLRKTWFWHASRSLRDMFLSILTLINNRANDPAMPPPGVRVNSNEFVALSIVFTELLTLILAAAIPHPWYSVNFDQQRHPSASLVCVYIFGTLGAVILGFLTGYLAAWPIAGERGKIVARYDWLYFLFPIATFPVYWWFLNDGSTDGGKLGYTYPAGATSVDQITKLTFPGYPDPAKSPYSLPFEKGTSAECVQGNHGIFSHNAIGGTVQIFAYDFSLPFGTDILCMRDGTVVGGNATTDPIPDGTKGVSGGPNSNSGANMVTIKHNGPPDAQDVDSDGNTKTTYALYLHGAQGTIPAVFKVAGAPVKKGQVIMKVNSTGNSRFNHVHVDIRPDDGAGNPQPYTIPFVFSEVGGDGVPLSNRYYESQNTKVP